MHKKIEQFLTGVSLCTRLTEQYYALSFPLQEELTKLVRLQQHKRTGECLLWRCCEADLRIAAQIRANAKMSATNNENIPHTYETIQNQAPSAVPNWNTSVPTYQQNVSPPLPAYSASPSTQMWAIPTVTPQWSVASVMAPNTHPSSPFYQTFLKSKPKALGIVLIISAILEIGLGIALGFTSFSITLPSGIPFWGPIFYIIAGVLTICAHPKPNVCLIRGSLSLNIITSVFSTIALIINIVDLAVMESFRNCYYYTDYYNNDYERCKNQLNGGYAVLSFLLIINLLLFCVSLSLSIFGCRSLSQVSSNSPQVFLIQNDVVVSTNLSTVPATFAGYAQSFSPENAPPPYVFQDVKARPMA
ncbi:membrane-spanning 4-domains subfamily A member 8-like isoform X2 [Phyllobates terribilis]|uniref:membrane-spanning 4-domains subfamily A member 8-like isoform X2 n=1 Tax=Phyllobates terribilis TaxID=111132 RepID=UPI003CCA8CED